jgi:hypothetical protein
MKNLLEEIPTNINYTNNNNYNNYNNYNNDITTNNYNNSRWSVDQNGVVGNNCVPPASLGKPTEKNIVVENEGLRKLPPAWKSAKWDLFLNGTLKSGLPNLKLKLWFVHKTTGKEFVYMAALNTPWSSGRMSYNVSEDEWKNSKHWRTVVKHYHTINKMYDDVRCSKLAQTYKGSPTPVAVFCYQDLSEWFVDMVLEGQVYTYNLCDELSEKQKLTTQIATAIIGSKQKPMLTLEEGGFV